MSIKTVILLTCLAAAFAPFAAPCPLETLVRAKLTNYSQWLKDGNLDPSPLRAGPDAYDFIGPLISLRFELRNHGVAGHSGRYVIDNVRTSIDAELQRGNFVFDCELIDNVTFFGEYSAFGTINNKPVSLQGEWFIRAPNVSNRMFEIRFERTSDGYMNITYPLLYAMNPARDDDGIYFENLLEHPASAGYEEIVLNSVYQRYMVEHVMMDAYVSTAPYRRLWVDFWQEVLSNTRWEDVTD